MTPKNPEDSLPQEHEVDEDNINVSQKHEPEQDEQAREHERESVTETRTYFYAHPVAGEVAVEERTLALRALFKLLEVDSLKELAKWAQHFYDDRVVRAWETYKGTFVLQDALSKERAKASADVRTIQKSRLAKRLSELEAQKDTVDALIARAEDDLLAAGAVMVERVSIAGHEVHFPDPRTTEDADRIKAAHRRDGRSARWYAETLNKIVFFVKKLGTKNIPLDPSGDQSETVRLGTVEHETQASQVPGKYGRPNIVRSLIVGNLPVNPMEAAEELGIPFYLGCEITEEHLEGMKDHMDGAKLESLKLWMHSNIDRRYYSPLIRQGKGISINFRQSGWLKNIFGLTTFGLIFGLFVGLSLGLAFGWMSPMNLAPSLGKALNPFSWVVPTVREGTQALASQKAGSGTSKPTDPVAPIIIFTLWALGYAVAYISRYAVTIPFLTAGEAFAERRLPSSRPVTGSKRGQVILPWLIPALVLICVAGAEVGLEKCAFERISYASELQYAQQHPEVVAHSRRVAEEERLRAANARKAGTPEAQREEPPETVEHRDQRLAGEVSGFAAFLVLAGYLLYGSGEGFLRGRDARYGVAITKKVSDMTVARQIAAGITDAIMTDALHAVSEYDRKRTYVNGLLVDQTLAGSVVKVALAELQALEQADAEGPADVSALPAVQKAYADFVGANVEFDRLMDELLALNKQALKTMLTAREAERAEKAEEARRKAKRASKAEDEADKRLDEENRRKAKREAKEEEEVDRLREEESKRKAKRIRQAEEDADKIREQVRRMVGYIVSDFDSEIKAKIDVRKTRRPGFVQRARRAVSNAPQTDERSLQALVEEFVGVVGKVRVLLADIHVEVGAAENASSSEPVHGQPFVN